MDITITVQAPELCAALRELAESLRSPRTPAPLPQTEAPVQFPPFAPALAAPVEAPVAQPPAVRKRRTNAEMEADAARKAQATAPAAPVEAKEAAPEQAPLAQSPAASVTPATATTAAPGVNTGYPVPTDLASLKAIAVSHATDVEKGMEHVKFCLGKFSAATLSTLNPALYGQFAAALYAMRELKG